MTRDQFYDAIRTLGQAEAGGYKREELAALNAILELMEQALAEVVSDARTNGLSWKDVADALGRSPQAVQQRFGRTARAQRGVNWQR